MTISDQKYPPAQAIGHSNPPWKHRLCRARARWRAKDRSSTSMPIFGGERVGLFHGVAVRYIETLPLFRGKHSGFFGKRTDMIERRFKFIWSRTWPDREQDFVAACGRPRPAYGTS